MKSKFLACLALTTICGGIFGSATAAQARPVDGPQPGSVFVDVDFNGIFQRVELGFLGFDNDDPNKLLYGFDEGQTYTLTDDEGNTMDLNDLSTVLDPLGTFAVAFTDVGAPSPLTATFKFPIAPAIGTTYIGFLASLGLSMTDSGTPRNGASATGNSSLNPQTMTSYKFYGPNGSAFLPLGLGDSASVGTSGSRTDTFSYDSDPTASNICINLGGCTSYDIIISFLGSGGRDQYGFTGSLEFNGPGGDIPVPEPLTMMGAATAVGFGTAFKRKLGKKKDQNKA